MVPGPFRAGRGLVSIGALHLKKLLRKLHFKSLKYNNSVENCILKSYFENYTLKA